MTLKLLNSWQKYYKFRTRYCTWKRDPFFELANAYMPSNKDAVLVDLGAGDGRFAEVCEWKIRYKNAWLLDGNPQTIGKLKTQFDNVQLYQAPDRMPFDDACVELVHCSHLIEHLYHDQLHTLFREFDRILKIDGVLIISTPLLFQEFYAEISHIKPYHPQALNELLVTHSSNPTLSNISTKYRQLNLTYRYWPADLDEGWGSSFAPLDFIFHYSRRLLGMLRITKFRKTGYTVIYRKVLK